MEFFDFFPAKLDNEWWLNVAQWISTGAIAVTLASAYCVNIFSDRVNRRMRVEIANTNALAAKSHERAEEIQSRNLQLGLELEKERQARLDIERRLAPRFIADKERQIIAEAIDLFPQHSIKIAAIGNPESVLYAEQFAQLFEASSWRVEKIEGALLGPAQYGLFLLVPKAPGNAAQSLISALHKAGIVFKQEIDDRLKPDGIELRVGDKNPTQTSPQLVR